MKPLHLTRRFGRGLLPARIAPADDAWAIAVLEPAEAVLWRNLPVRERAHAVEVGRQVERRLAGTPFAGDDRWIAAALLHDVGKLDAPLGVPGRVVATLARAAGARRRAAEWSRRQGLRRRLGRYLRYPELGAARLRRAGGREEVARWAAAHHERDAWAGTGIPGPVVEALVEADDAAT